MNRLAIATPPSRVSSTKKSASDVDFSVSTRIRQRRIMSGITQHQMAELIGVTFQQAHKYERGINRISAARLYRIAEVLGVEVGYFFEDVDPGSGVQTGEPKLLPQQRLLLELARNFVMIKNREQQDAVCRMARALSHRD